MKYFTNLSEKERRVVDKILVADDIPILEHGLISPMREGTKQSNSVAFGLMTKAALFTQEMGFGKSYTVYALINELLRVIPKNKKVLYCCTNDKLKEDVKNLTEELPPGTGVIGTTAGRKQVERAFNRIRGGDRVMVFTHSVWDTEYHFHRELIPILDQFDVFILDEGGMVLKNTDNYSYRCMMQFVPQMEYRYILNATPIEKDLQLLLNQLRVLGLPIPSQNQIYRRYGTLNEEAKRVFHNLGDLQEQTKYHVFNMSRADLNISVNLDIDVRLMKTTPVIQDLISEDGVRNLRFPFIDHMKYTPMNYPSLENLINIALEGKRNGEHILAYVTNVEPKKYMKEILTELGLEVGIYDGHHTNTQERKVIVERNFNEGKYDIMLTNRMYGLSLGKASHVVMYDLPPNYMQYIYRAIRDLKDITLKVTALIYEHQRDFNNLEEELRAEVYQNEYSGRGFNVVKTMIQQVNDKQARREYD